MRANRARSLTHGARWTHRPVSVLRATHGGKRPHSGLRTTTVLHHAGLGHRRVSSASAHIHLECHTVSHTRSHGSLSTASARGPAKCRRPAGSPARWTSQVDGCAPCATAHNHGLRRVTETLSGLAAAAQAPRIGATEGFASHLLLAPCAESKYIGSTHMHETAGCTPASCFAQVAEAAAGGPTAFDGLRQFGLSAGRAISHTGADAR